MRALFSKFGFAISVFLTVAITTAFAVVFEASQEFVVSPFVIGLGAAMADYVMRCRRLPPKPTEKVGNVR